MADASPLPPLQHPNAARNAPVALLRVGLKARAIFFEECGQRRLTPATTPARGALLPRAQMAELVDAPASGAGARKGVEVRVLFWAPLLI